MDAPTLALVVWNDASGSAEDPVTLDSVHEVHKPMQVTTLGWVLKDDDIGITLVNEFYSGVYRGRTTILRGMIVSVTHYKLTKAKLTKTKPPKAKKSVSPAQSPESVEPALDTPQA